MTTPRPQLSGHPASMPARPALHEPDPLRPGLHEPDLHEPGGYPARVPVLPPFPRQPARLRPLPDVVAVRRMPLPDSAPPYDDQPAGCRPASSRAAEPRPSRAAQAGPRPDPPERARRERPGRPQARPDQVAPEQAGAQHVAPDGAGPEQARTEQAGPEGARPRAGQPGLAGVTEPWPSQFAQALAEALAGARPPQQLTSWTTQRARSRIRQLGPLLQAGPRPRVRRVVACAPAGDVVELAVVVSIGPAVRALAVRLERISQFPPGQPRRQLPPGQISPGQAPPGRGGSASHGLGTGRGPGWLCTDIEAA